MPRWHAHVPDEAAELVLLGLPGGLGAGGGRPPGMGGGDAGRPDAGGDVPVGIRELGVLLGAGGLAGEASGDQGGARAPAMEYAAVSKPPATWWAEWCVIGAASVGAASTLRSQLANRTPRVAGRHPVRRVKEALAPWHPDAWYPDAWCLSWPRREYLL